MKPRRQDTVAEKRSAVRRSWVLAESGDVSRVPVVLGRTRGWVRVDGTPEVPRAVLDQLAARPLFEPRGARRPGSPFVAARRLPRRRAGLRAPELAFPRRGDQALAVLAPIDRAESVTGASTADAPVCAATLDGVRPLILAASCTAIAEEGRTKVRRSPPAPRPRACATSRCSNCYSRTRPRRY